jgi:CDP-diacylglycerol--glycerol-3-phosphate 3-phosphatidyltransferase
MEITWANRITIMRILLIPPFIILMLKANDPDKGRMMRYIAVGIFLLMCVSDVLDGYVARIRKEVTRLGAFLDPLADKLLMLCACVILSGQTTAIDNFKMPITVVVLIIGKDIFLALGFITVFMMVTSEVHLKPVAVGKFATFLQLSMVLSVLVAPEMYARWAWWWYVPRILWWTATSIAIATVFMYIRTGANYIQKHE